MQKRPHYHTNRVNEDIARELMYILQNVKDPRVSKSFVSVTKTETTPDLKYCKIYYSNLSGNDKGGQDRLVFGNRLYPQRTFEPPCITQYAGA